MGTRKNSAEFVQTLALVRRRNAMIYRASTLKSVPFRSDPFLATDIAAIFGASDAVQKTYFDCRVVGTEAKKMISAVCWNRLEADPDAKVLVAFKLGDLYAEPFTYKKGKKAGETGVSLKARLLRIDWVKVNGETVYTAPRPQDQEDAPAAATADEGAQKAA